MRIVMLGVLYSTLVLSQEAVAYRISEPDAAEGKRLFDQYQQAKQSLEKWKREASAKYSSGGKPLDFTFDFRLAVPHPEDPNKLAPPPPIATSWSSGTTTADTIADITQ